MCLTNILNGNITKQLISFYEIVEQLKYTMRYDNQENIADSVADHSFRLGVMAYVISEHYNLNIDTLKAVNLALIHDMGEHLHGDVDQRKIREGLVSKEEKDRLEEEGITKLKKSLPPVMCGYFSDLWSEYKSMSTPEAKFVKALDKLETMLRVSNKGYKVFTPSFTGEKDNKGYKLINYADTAVLSFPVLSGLNSIVKNRLKTEFEKGNYVWPVECNAFLDCSYSEDLVKIVSFFDAIENLKCELRYGKNNKTSMSESVAGHVFKLAVMTFSFAKQYDLDLDVYRAVKLALVHDLGECFDGDIPASDIHLGEITKEEKSCIEERGFRKLCDILPEKLGKDLFGLWDDYEKGVIKEAKYVKALDKMEAQLHVCSIGEHRLLKSYSLTPVYADEAVKELPFLKDMLKQIKLKMKHQFKKEKLEWKPIYNFGLRSLS